jgi:hypothetical protein
VKSKEDNKRKCESTNYKSRPKSWRQKRKSGKRTNVGKPCDGSRKLRRLALKRKDKKESEKKCRQNR